MGDNFFASIIHGVNQLLAQTGGLMHATGMNIFRDIAVAMLTWMGLKIAFSQGAEEDRMFGIAAAGRYCVLVVGCWCLLAWYNTPIPGLGENFHSAITGGGAYLTAQIESGMQDRLVDKFQHVILAMESPSWTDWFANMPGWIHYMTAQWSITLLQSVMSAVVAFGPVATGILVLFGPLFIPMIMVPKLEQMFWAWLFALIQYTFYGPVAQAFVYVYGLVFINFFDRNPGPYTSEKLAEMTLTVFGLTLSMVFGIFKVSSLTADMFRGSSGQIAFPGAGWWRG